MCVRRGGERLETRDACTYIYYDDDDDGDNDDRPRVQQHLIVYITLVRFMEKLLFRLPNYQKCPM